MSYSACCAWLAGTVQFLFEAWVMSCQFKVSCYCIPMPSRKSWNFFVKLQDLESPGNDFGPGKSWKFKLNVLESPGICWDADAMMRTQTKNIFLCYMWQWWTLQYECYCCILICRVSNCCLRLYLHVAGDYKRVLENTFGVLEELWNLFWARQWEPSVARIAEIKFLDRYRRSVCVPLKCDRS